MTAKNKSALEQVRLVTFKKKAEYHRNLAKLPIEEKLRIVGELQELARSIKRRGANISNKVPAERT